MQKQISDDDASNVLKKPEHILSFVKHALENPSQTDRSSTKKSSSNAGLRMDDLRIVEDQSDELDEGDSDDEDPNASNEETVDDITTTAVKLLLAVLEGARKSTFSDSTH